MLIGIFSLTEIIVYQLMLMGKFSCVALSIEFKITMNNDINIILWDEKLHPFIA